jgi:membrane protease YdiL (CAAX protease family)
MVAAEAHPEHSLTSPRWVWGSNKQLMMVLAVIVVNSAFMFGLAFGVLRPLLQLEPPYLSGSPNEIAATLSLIAYTFIFLRLVLGKLCGVSLHDLGWDVRRLAPDLGLGLLAFCFTQCIFFAVLHATGRSFDWYLDAQASFPIGRRIECLTIGILASFSEESIFRGYMQRGLEARLPRALALTLTAAVFSVKHLRFDAWLLTAYFIYGLTWGWLASKTKRLFPGAFAHFLSWSVNAGI